MDYSIRALTGRDLPMIAEWLRQQHWSQWWDDPETEIGHIKDHMESISVEPLIAEWQGRPIAYVQTYDPHMEDDHPYQDQPFGTLGIDLSIGPPDLLGQGHGPALLRQLARDLFNEGAPRLIIDPDPANTRAIRAYEKAGFRAFDTRTSEYGPALMMALEPGKET